MKDKSQISRFLLWTCLATALNGCAIYSTVDVPVTKITKKKYLAKEEMVWTIEDATHVVRVIQNRHIQTDSIFGKLVTLKYPDHPGKKKTYLRNKGKASVNYSASLNYLHLHLDEKSILSDSTILKIPLSAVTSVTKHKNKRILLVTGSAVAIIISIGVWLDSLTIGFMAGG